MAGSLTAGIVLLLSLFVLSHQADEDLWLLDAERLELDERGLKELETRKLFKDVEQLEQVEQELAKRSELEALYDELVDLELNNQKREIRQTPQPAVKRLKMTPPPNVPQPIYRLQQTPAGNVPLRQTPAPPEYPYNLVDKPLRQTPRPLRLTPAPPAYQFQSALEWLNNRKREIRQTPQPAVKRLKMTPPSNVPQPIYRLQQTPAHVPLRPTPAPGELVKPLRQTPRPLRITPEPPVRPAIYPHENLEEEQEMWAEQEWRELMEREVEDEDSENQRRSELTVGYLNRLHAQRERNW